MRKADEVAREIVRDFHQRGKTGLTQLEYDIAQAILEARREALEEAAKIAVINDRNGYLHGCTCAMDIRALAEKEGG